MLRRFLLLIGIFLLVPSLVLADSGDLHRQFSRGYGLFVHQGNRDRPISQGLALQVLGNYFRVDKSLFEDKSDGEFHATIDTKDLLVLFFRMKDPNNAAYRTSDASQDYRNAWKVGHALNIIPSSEGDATYDFLSELLYRDHLSQTHFNLPYAEGVVEDIAEVTADRFHNLREIDRILSGLYRQISLLKRSTRRMPEEVQYLDSLKAYQQAYRVLKKDLLRRPYPLQVKSDYSPEVTRAVRENHLQDLLAEYSYDYSKNPAYRQHNVTTGLMKMNGRVVMPQEEVSYWNVLSDKNLTDFNYGWVIVGGGREEWQWGGGICGAATGVFNPVWRSGLSIVERKPHSVYFKSLYVVEDIGLDTTVYRPKPDFRFKNNLQDPIVFSVENNEQNKVITVRILGNSLYRRVKIEGPIVDLKKNREVEWVRQMEYFDGTRQREILASRYNAIR